ncbi:hypothetical protein TNCV_3434661 [Trichonephila clavipes]|nr:hypothetical protein TNCV_3434661 [Trichonephila clavipes]
MPLMPCRRKRVFESTTRSRLAGLVWPDVANDDFQQNRCSLSLAFNAIYHNTTGRNLPETKEFHSVQMPGLLNGFWA